nr:MAG TPA: hypothetical protein [Caudoviricetes sp.]DAU04917.1 MAG TPA: hypothetical protein [Caudoviricetes sp.]
MNTERMKFLLQKCAEWLDNMNIKTIDDSYKKVAIFESIKEIFAEINKAEEEDDAGTDH